MSIIISLIMLLGNLVTTVDGVPTEQQPVDVEIEILTDEGGAG